METPGSTVKTPDLQLLCLFSASSFTLQRSNMSSKSLRSLMKDRQLARRIQHQFAKYDSLGRLTCTICNGLTVKSEALWPSHLSSKPHRVNYQQYNQTSLKALTDSDISTSQQTNTLLSKRKSKDESQSEDIDPGSSHHHLQDKKIRLTSMNEKDEEGEGNLKTIKNSNPSSFLPENFFDDPSEAPQLQGGETSKENDPEKEEDEEWREFQAALQQQQPDTREEDTPANLFAQASVIAEPVFYQQGLDQSTNAILQSNSLEQEDPSLVEQEEQEEVEEEEDPIEKKIREEKEEIMDRIQNEEREQLEADQRVLRMKARIEAFRSKRKKPTQK